MSEAERKRARRALVALGAAVLFFGLASFFAWALKPLTEGPAVAVAAQVAPEPAMAQQQGPVLAAAVPATAPVSAEPKIEPFEPAFKGPRIAILLTEAGVDPAATQLALETLPPAVGLAFSPYPAESRALAAAAQARGHEVWIGVPMQPKSWPKVSPGENTLLIENEAAENLRRLDWALARVPGAVGATNMMGSAFTESREALRPVLGGLKARGLVFVDGRVTATTRAAEEARAIGLPSATNRRFIEGPRLARQLHALEVTAWRSGSAVAFAIPTKETVAAIRAWAEGLRQRGVLLVPPGTLAR